MLDDLSCLGDIVERKRVISCLQFSTPRLEVVQAGVCESAFETNPADFEEHLPKLVFCQTAECSFLEGLVD